MPRAGAGGGGGLGGSGHGSGLSGSGHRPSMGGAGNRAGGGQGGFGGFSGGAHGFDSFGGFGGDPGFGGPGGPDDMGGFGGPGMGGPGMYGGPPRRSHHSGLSRDIIGMLAGAAIGNAIGKSNARREQQVNQQYNPTYVPQYQQPQYGAPGGGQVPPAGAPAGSPGAQPQQKKSSHIALISIIVAVVIFLLILMMPSCSSNGSSSSSGSASGIPASTVNREKVSDPVSFDTHCVVDQLGWVNNTTSTCEQLKPFYDKTGVQPYVVLAKYNASLTDDSAKEAWAKQWYTEHIDNQDTALFVYFAEQDQDNDVGYMYLALGKRTERVMDSNAQDIFWSYIDQNWYSNKSTETVLADSFNDTATRIMKHTTNRNDVAKWIIITVCVALVAIAIIVVVIVLMRRRREHEQYVERMVNTPLETAEDPLLKKYGQDGGAGNGGAPGTNQ